MNFSSITLNLKGQKMFQIMERALTLERSGREILHFEIGDPDFSSPEVAKLALKEAIDSNITKYAPSSGILEYKEACQVMTKRSRGFSPDLSQILVTPGANIQIYLACACLIDPGDEIIIQDPCFVSYESIIHTLRGTVVRAPLSESNQFVIDPADIARLVTSRTKAIIINSPHNPTGSVISEDVFREIYHICDKHGLYLLSDEVYGRMIYHDSPVRFFSPSQIDSCTTRTVVFHSLSKTYAMTGWRIGAVTGPSCLVKKMTLLYETINSCVPPFIQCAAARLLKQDPAASQEMINHYTRRRDVFMRGMLDVDKWSCIKPFGAFYAFVNITKTGMQSEPYANYLLNQYGIASCPGIYFGPSGEGYLRFSFASSEQSINKMFAILDG
jgi:aspartate aminotransferase